MFYNWKCEYLLGTFVLVIIWHTPHIESIHTETALRKLHGSAYAREALKVFYVLRSKFQFNVPIWNCKKYSHQWFYTGISKSFFEDKDFLYSAKLLPSWRLHRWLFNTLCHQMRILFQILMNKYSLWNFSSLFLPLNQITNRQPYTPAKSTAVRENKLSPKLTFRILTYFFYRNIFQNKQLQGILSLDSTTEIRTSYDLSYPQWEGYRKFEVGRMGHFIPCLHF